MPARSDDRIVSGSAVVFSAMIIGSPAAPRMEATRPSSGSFQALMSTSTTSGRMRSRRSRKLLTSPRSWCSTMIRNGSVAQQSPASAPRVPGFRLPGRWSADTCGVSRSPAHFAAPPAAAAGARPGFTGGGGCRAAPAPESSGAAAWRRSRLAFLALLISCSTGIVSSGGFTGTGPVLSMPGCAFRRSLFLVMKGYGILQRRAAAGRPESAAPLPA